MDPLAFMQQGQDLWERMQELSAEQLAEERGLGELSGFRVVGLRFGLGHCPGVLTLARQQVSQPRNGSVFRVYDGQVFSFTRCGTARGVRAGCLVLCKGTVS